MNKATITHTAHLETITIDGIDGEVLTCEDTSIDAGDSIILPDGDSFVPTTLHRRMGEGITVSGFAKRHGFTAVRFPKAW